MTIKTMRLIPLPPAPATDDFAVYHDLDADGWQPGPPESLPAAALAVDVATAAALHCGFCSFVGGQSFAAFHRGREYRAFAVCPACHSTEEL